MKTRRHSTPRARRPSGRSASSIDTTEREASPNTPNSCGPDKVPPQWKWHFHALMKLRDRLLQAHAEHAREATLPPETDSNDIADYAQAQSNRDLLWAELGSEDGRLFEIDCALQRIRDGVYGFCEETGLPIPAERLRAIPWTRYSRVSAERHEKPRKRPAFGA